MTSMPRTVMKGTIQFKCRRCGETFDTGEFENAIITMEDAMQGFGRFGIIMWQWHECNDNQIGIGDLIGCEEPPGGVGVVEEPLEAPLEDVPETPTEEEPPEEAPKTEEPQPAIPTAKPDENTDVNLAGPPPVTDAVVRETMEATTSARGKVKTEE